jgi:ATP-dependent DNA helicase DinG
LVGVTGWPGTVNGVSESPTSVTDAAGIGATEPLLTDPLLTDPATTVGQSGPVKAVPSVSEKPAPRKSAGTRSEGAKSASAKAVKGRVTRSEAAEHAAGEGAGAESAVGEGAAGAGGSTLAEHAVATVEHAVATVGDRTPAPTSVVLADAADDEPSPAGPHPDQASVEPGHAGHASAESAHPDHAAVAPAAAAQGGSATSAQSGDPQPAAGQGSDTATAGRSKGATRGKPAPLTTTPDGTVVPDVATLLRAAVNAVGGAERSGQVDMAEAVARSIRTGEHLAVQAGTGTGKSLAYLVPAIRHAVAEDATVVISTATIALQRQLVDRDLPRLAAALKPLLGREPTFAILKGRRNYLCLHRVHTGAPDEPDDGALFDPFAASAIGRQVKRLHEWSSDTETGDRDELVPGVGEQAWRQVSVTARECLGVARCPVGTDCFAERARAEAGRADVVVTNHAMLAINALEGYQVLPEHDVVVVDEAHDLVDRVTSAATAEISGSSVTTAARRTGRLIDQEVADRLAEAGDGLTLMLTELPVGRMDELPEPLRNTLRAVRDAARSCIVALGPERAAQKENVDDATQHKLARAMLDDTHDTADRLLDAFDEGDAHRKDVVWVSGDTDRPATIRVAPLGVGGLLRERLFAHHTTVLTSATLTLGGAFDTLARQWGLPATSSQARKVEGMATEKPPPADGIEGPRWTGLDVGSPFEHERSGILYVAKHLPPPGRDGLGEPMLTELRELVEAAGGRTLGLFSSMRAAKQAAETLREQTDHPILCQGEDSTALLVTKFAEDPRTCLFGTLSLWQGVDVPGPSLQLVVVDRIPFPRPDDPLASARQRAVAARGGNGFLTVAATHAALLLAQGAGRLLRSMGDKGVVAVLDSRLATARYGGFLRASLPPFWSTMDPGVVRGALHRLDEAAPV